MVDLPHPRDASVVIGHDAAARTMMTARATGRLHHAWMLTGPRGVGKATFAYAAARALIAGRDNFDVPEDHPVARRIRAGSEPCLRLVCPTENEKTGRMRDAIVVDDIRALSGFLGLSAADGGHRVVIIDAADAMNTAAANALLKMLEEPPERATLLLVVHQPTALLPTIRSRCQVLRFAPLGVADLDRALSGIGIDVPDDITALSQLAGGSVGVAAGLLAQDGLKIYAEIVRLLGTLPRIDRGAALQFAEAAAARGDPGAFPMRIELLETALGRLARSAALGVALPDAAPGESEVFARLASDPVAARRWAETAQSVIARARQGAAVNLDVAALVTDTLSRLQEACE